MYLVYMETDLFRVAWNFRRRHFLSECPLLAWAAACALQERCSCCEMKLQVILIESVRKYAYDVGGIALYLGGPFSFKKKKNGDFSRLSRLVAQRQTAGFWMAREATAFAVHSWLPSLGSARDSPVQQTAPTKEYGSEGTLSTQMCW